MWIPSILSSQKHSVALGVQWDNIQTALHKAVSPSSPHLVISILYTLHSKQTSLLSVIGRKFLPPCLSTPATPHSHLMELPNSRLLLNGHFLHESVADYSIQAKPLFPLCSEKDLLTMSIHSRYPQLFCLYCLSLQLDYKQKDKDGFFLSSFFSSQH